MGALMLGVIQTWWTSPAFLIPGCM